MEVFVVFQLHPNASPTDISRTAEKKNMTVPLIHSCQATN